MFLINTSLRGITKHFRYDQKNRTETLIKISVSLKTLLGAVTVVRKTAVTSIKSKP